MKYIILFFCILLSATTYAQTLTGRIIDQQNQPVSFANVIVLDSDSTFINGNVSGEDGKFQIEVAKQAALLKISYLGYQDLFLPIQNKMDMGIIQLQEDVTTLDEVVVKGTLPVTKIKGDAMVTSIENTVLSKVGSANDVLQKIPGVTKNDNAFTVFGKGEPLIYINGREVMNKEELERLNSDEIKNVELITNPGSRYNATVKAVIRIQTVKRQGDGFGMDLRSSYYQSQNADTYNHWNINYRHNNWDVFVDGYYKLMNFDWKQESEIINNVDDVWTQTDVSEEKVRENELNSTLGFNYMPKENHSLGMKYDITGYLDYASDVSMESTVGLNGNRYDKLHNQSHAYYKNHLTHTLNGYYNGKVGDLSINLNIDYYKQSYDYNSTTFENSEDKENREICSKNPVDNQLAAAKLIFEYPLLGGNLSFGSKYTYTLRSDDYLSYSETYIPTSYSKIREHNIAAFLEYQHALSFGQFTAGLRYEHDNFKYYENLIYRPDESRTFDNFFPNASFSTRIGNVQLQTSYAAKTNRPSYYQLSNNMIYYNRFTRRIGNPTLKPAITHDITLTGVWRFFQAMVSFQQKRDPILQWSNPDADDHSIAITTHQNFDKLPTLSALIAATPTIGCWSPTFAIAVTKQWFDITYDNQKINMSDPMLMASFKNLITLPWGLTFGADFSFRGKGHVENFYKNENAYICDISLQKNFLKDTLTVELRGTDLLHEPYRSGVRYMNRLMMFGKTTSDTREFAFTLRYKFNMTPSKYKGTGAGAEQKSRF